MLLRKTGRFMKAAAIGLGLLALPFITDAAETAVQDLFDVSLEDLLNQTVVSATKSPQRLSETPAAVRVVTARQIKERGYLTLSDLMTDLPGIQFRNIQGFNSYVFMRGAPSQNNLILLLVDGVEINELNSGGFYGGLQFNLANVKRVEVVCGPASTLYGTNAGSGIINIITHDPQDEAAQGTVVSGTIGSFNTYRSAFRTASYDPEKRRGYSLSGMYIDTDKMDLGGAAGDDNWTEGMENFERAVAFDGKITWHDLTFGFLFQDKQSSRSTNYQTVGDNYLDRDTLWHITFLNLWLRHEYDVFPDLQLKSLAWYRDTTVQDDTVGRIYQAAVTNLGQVGYYRPNNQFGVEEQINWQATGSLRLTGGLVFKYDNLAEDFSFSFSGSQDQSPPKPSKPNILRENLLSGYLQTQWKILENLEWTAGIRADHSTVYDNVFTPRSGFVYQRNKFTAKLLYSEAYRAPKPWDYNYGAGNPGLEPEEIESYEGSLAYWVHTNLSVGITMYRNQIDNLLVRNTSADRWENQGQAVTDGVELSTDYTWKELMAYANYTFNQSEDEAGEPVPEIAEQDANAGVTWNLNKHWMLHLRGEYLGERTNPSIISATGDDQIDDAFLLHGGVGLSWNDWYFNLSVHNLLDEKYYHTSNRPPDRYRQDERSVRFAVEYRF